MVRLFYWVWADPEKSPVEYKGLGKKKAEN